MVSGFIYVLCSLMDDLFAGFTNCTNISDITFVLSFTCVICCCCCFSVLCLLFDCLSHVFLIVLRKETISVMMLMMLVLLSDCSRPGGGLLKSGIFLMLRRKSELLHHFPKVGPVDLVPDRDRWLNSAVGLQVLPTPNC